MDYLKWSWDPDPDDTWARTEYAFLLKEPDGSTHVVHETHRLGLFPDPPGCGWSPMRASRPAPFPR